MVYLDCAATTEITSNVKNEIIKCLDIYGNPSSAHEIGEKAHKIVVKARDQIETTLGLEKNSLIFTSGGSEADSLIIKGVVPQEGTGKKIITSAIEHHAILNACEESGARISYLQPNKYGIITIDELRRNLTPDTTLVSIMAVNNELGTIQPIKELAAYVKSVNPQILFHTDFVQGLGKIILDTTNIDFISYSAHKIHGPKGMGGVYVRPQARNRLLPLISGGKQEFHLRGGTENVPYIAGFARAVTDIIKNLQSENTESFYRRRLLTEALTTNIPNIFFNSRVEQCVPEILSVTIPGAAATAIQTYMSLAGYYISTGSACNTGSDIPSHVLTAIGLSKEQANSTIRISFDCSLTEQEIDDFAKTLSTCTKKLRKMAGE